VSSNNNIRKTQLEHERTQCDSSDGSIDLGKLPV